MSPTRLRRLPDVTSDPFPRLDLSSGSLPDSILLTWSSSSTLVHSGSLLFLDTPPAYYRVHILFIMELFSRFRNLPTTTGHSRHHPATASVYPVHSSASCQRLRLSSPAPIHICSNTVSRFPRYPADPADPARPRILLDLFSTIAGSHHCVSASGYPCSCANFVPALLGLSFQCTEPIWPRG